ncbi:TrbI F-type domain-containing protein [Erythrobacter sp. EC-HK427]|uniref:TrbI F-type domain-containing protein n=1 Tax=Erythrobacter sp. EC-HK427 TaxID=2038396 RepID=UPI001259CA31|nr:TrbI F-type domain-containing protein [Erythrobacter sp. EC-HK427]VVT00637.1 conserved hypothetical protein [Erythrobacter sp. EC-HK427]
MADRTAWPSLGLKIAAILAGAGVLLWAGWITREVYTDTPRPIVSVRLAETIGGFVDEAARTNADPETVQAASLAYLQAAEAAVAEMGEDGRLVLVAEAVLGGPIEDATPELEARIAAKLAAEAQP